MMRRAFLIGLLGCAAFLPSALAGSGAAQGVNGTVRALAWQQGFLYVGGDFSNAGGIGNADRVARWNGTWSELGTCGGPCVSQDVRALGLGPVLVSKQGRRSSSNVYAGGFLVNVGGVANADRLARWNGTSWFSVGNTQGTGTVLAILRVGTSLYVGGDFTDFGGDPQADYVARWTGTQWADVGGGVNDIVHALAWRSGSLYVGGEFTDVSGISAADKVARWNGSSWSALGSGLGETNGVHALAFRGSDLYVGGTFLNAGGVAAADRVARWDGANWSALGSSGLSAAVYALAVRGSTVYVGGEFDNAGGFAAADSLAAWSGSAWAEVCGGLAGAGDTVYALLARGANDLYVGGNFDDAGGVPTADNVARCSGMAWSGF